MVLEIGSTLIVIASEVCNLLLLGNLGRQHPTEEYGLPCWAGTTMNRTHPNPREKGSVRGVESPCHPYHQTPVSLPRERGAALGRSQRDSSRETVQGNGG